MSKRNKMTVGELTGFLNGVVMAGHGDAEAYICLDHGNENRDELYDLGIDSISILNSDGDIAVAINSFLFHDCVEDMTERFGYKGLIE